MKIACDGFSVVFFFFCSFSTDSKVTGQKVDAWSSNKGEIEIYKPLSSYLVPFLGRKIKGQCTRLPPGGTPAQPPAAPWRASQWVLNATPHCESFLLNSERISNTLWRRISAAPLHPLSPHQGVLNSTSPPTPRRGVKWKGFFLSWSLSQPYKKGYSRSGFCSPIASDSLYTG